MKSPIDLLKRTPFMVSPMDEVTDIGFRKLCEDLGSAYTVTELTSVESLVRQRVNPSRYKKENLDTNCIQLFGSSPQTFVDAANCVYDEADFFDINFGCPSARVTGNDCGSMLLKDPKNVGAIVSKMVTELDKPITAKIRLGYDKTTYLEVAKEVENSGAQMLAVHGRTGKQKYTGRANWNAIEEIYTKTDIFVCGNGDINNVEDIDSYLHSHCDALMIGRGAIGNPNIFKEFNEYLNDKNKYLKEQEKLEELSKDERDKLRKKEQKKLFLNYLDNLKHITLARETYRIQHQAMYFFKGISGVKELRQKLMSSKTLDEIMKCVEEF